MCSGGPASFLVVDDYAPMARALTRLLRSFGPVLVASTVAEAFDIVSAHAASAYVVETALRDGNGFDVIRAVRKDSRLAPVLVHSAAVSRESLSEAYVLGADYLLKPAGAREIELFAARARVAVGHAGSIKIEHAVGDWQKRHALTRSETELLRLVAQGHPRGSLSALRGVEESTIKKQITSFLHKTGHDSLDDAVIDLLRSMVD